MKKYILSPLCSALVIPGLGQIINQNLKKGLIILSVVFLLFVSFIIRLVFIIQSLAYQAKFSRLNSADIMERLKGEDLSFILYLGIAFAIIWIYAVLDAFREGKKIERQEGKKG